MTGDLLWLEPVQKSPVEKLGFPNFERIRQAASACSSQPGHVAGDSDQTVTASDVGLLRAGRIVCVLSAKEKDVDDDGDPHLAKVETAGSVRPRLSDDGNPSFPSLGGLVGHPGRGSRVSV